MDLLLIDCCLWISLAMSTGFVSISLCTSVMQSNGGVSWFLKTLLLIFFKLFSYNCMYLDIAFLTYFWVYFVVILRACIFAVLAIWANIFIHSCWLGSWFGGDGMTTWVWFFSSSIIGCVGQFGEFFMR